MVQFSPNVQSQILFWVSRLLEFKEELRQVGLLLKRTVPTPFQHRYYDLYECQILYTVIRVLKPKKIVDVGCAEGWSTFWILAAANRNHNDAEVYTNDIVPSCIAKTEQNIAKFDFSNVRWQTVVGDFRKTYKKMMPEPVDLFFFDTTHERTHIVFCIENIFPKLAESHSIAIHDAEREEGKYLLSEWYPQNQTRYCLLGNRCQAVKKAVPEIDVILPLKHGDVNKPPWPSASIWFFHNTINCPLTNQIKTKSQD